ncbi:MAG: trigger factor [Candidatus Eisenbacteria bacterium]|nr:trigger factor [Candidatus Eisenbacteria bacterium]
MGVQIPPLAIAGEAISENAWGTSRAAEETGVNGRMALKVEVKDAGSWKRVLEIEIPPEDVQTELDKVVAEFQRKAAIPGFRKGKAPRDVLEARFGHSLQSEFLDRIIPRFYKEALKEANLVAISQAEVGDLKFTKGEPLSFKATVEIWPEIEVHGYDGLKVTRENFETAGDDVEKELLRLQEIAAKLETVARPTKETDLVVVDFVRLGKDGRPIKKTRRDGALIDLSSPTLLKDFARGVLGASAGEERVISVHYSEDFPDKNLANQDVQLRINVREVKEKTLPEINDEFAKDYAGAATLDELKSRIRLNLEAEEKLRSRRAMEEKILEELITMNSFELPPSMVKDALDDIVSRREKEAGNLSPEEREKLREAFSPHVVRNLKKTVVVSLVGKKESLEVKEEEVKAEIAKIACEEGKEVSEIEKELQKGNGFERFRNAFFERKVLDFLLSKANIVEVQTAKPVERLIQTP